MPTSIPPPTDRALTDSAPAGASRRAVLALLGGAAMLVWTPRWAAALTPDAAAAMIRTTVDEVYAIISSGQPPAAMYRQFEGIFARHADVDAIARTTLGPAARSASAADFAAYKQALQGYVGRKYGKRFREFIGGRIEVTGARPVKSFIAVSSTAYLRGQSPFEVEWHVSDRSGRPLFFNLIIEGVNMLATERAEINAMLARRKGSVAALAGDLAASG